MCERHFEDAALESFNYRAFSLFESYCYQGDGMVVCCIVLERVVCGFKGFLHGN